MLKSLLSSICFIEPIVLNVEPNKRHINLDINIPIPLIPMDLLYAHVFQLVYIFVSIMYVQCGVAFAKTKKPMRYTTFTRVLIRCVWSGIYGVEQVLSVVFLFVLFTDEINFSTSVKFYTYHIFCLMRIINSDFMLMLPSLYEKNKYDIIIFIMKWAKFE